MNLKTYDGKTYEEALQKACDVEQTTSENLIINVLEEKSTLLKKNVKIEVLDYNSLINYLKELINEITKLMNLEVNLEVRRRENNLTIKLYSDHNALLIGKNGTTINALQTIVRQIVYNQLKSNINIILDVEDYKDRRKHHLEYLAKTTAKEVYKTQIEAKLDSMNSYERMIVHSTLAEDTKVYTESIGEEPNRCVVIKPRKDI